ncbi:phasin family protein [Catellatospora paridis]|uniref:phasin family protein n=1 Tax=Catellatospora paridis TaxID=1617086 RepID=UPI001E42917C|nr:hypothetical protein [Catellatospora paridis]
MTAVASKSGEPMQDVVKAYLELAFGLTEASKKKAEKTVKKAAKELLGKSGATAAQLQTMAEELVTTGLQNREAITRIVRLELDRALGRVGLATAEEVATLTARIEDLEAELREAKADRPASTTNGSSAAASPVVAPAPVAKKAIAKKAVAPAKATAPAKAAEPAAAPVEPVTTTPAAVAKRVKKAAPVVKAAPAKKAPAAKAEPSQETPIKGAAAARKPAKAVAKKTAKAVAGKAAAGVDAATAIEAVAKATSGGPEPVAPVAFSSAADVPVAAKKAPAKKTTAKKAPARKAATA